MAKTEKKPERAKVKRTPSGKLTAEARKRSETLPGGRFPMPDKQHARLALAMVNRAKGLTPAQKAKVRARARRILGKSSKGGE
ncbi:MAG: hypothetical protein QJR08_04315 [Bacillota bacterium]|nr:hypothetical protein [Bacillota bacterium]